MKWREERNIARKTIYPNKFLKHPNFLVRAGLLDNKYITSEIIDKLLKDDSILIREKLATQNIEQAINDLNWRVRYCAIKDNPNVSLKILEKLINDKDERVKKEAKRLLDIKNKYVYRENFDNVITIKLVVPGTCNANCDFCYNKNSNKMNIGTYELKQQWLNNFILSLEQIILKINERQLISIDITGNEPTLDTDFFIQIMHKLRNFSLKSKICRITCTTNGVGLMTVAPYMKDVVNYVNISVHDYNIDRRKAIFKTYSPTDAMYKDMVKILLDNDIYTSAISVISEEIDDFSNWRNEFINWANDIGFIGLRFRHNVYTRSDIFLKYMNETILESQYYTIHKENTPDSTWCQLATKDGFFIFFLKGVIDTYSVSPGIEFIIHDDGKVYADFNKKIRLENYNFPIGYIFDKK